MDHVVVATGAGGSLFRGIAHFSGVHSASSYGTNGRRFFTNYIAVLCWPIGWGIANLVTVALLNLALNPSNNTGLGALNFFGGGFIWWIGVGLWALFSSVAAPWLVTKALSAGENPLVSLFSAGVNLRHGANVPLDCDFGGGADDGVGDGGRIDCGGDDGGPAILSRAGRPVVAA